MSGGAVLALGADGEGILQRTITWFNDPLNYRGPDGVVALTVEHLWITFAAVVLACVVALPLGVWMGHRGRGGGFVVVVSNLSRAIPTLALLTIFAVGTSASATAPPSWPWPSSRSRPCWPTRSSASRRSTPTPVTRPAAWA